MTTRTAMVVAAITDYAVNDLIRHAMEYLCFRGPHRIQRRPPGAVNMPHPTWFAWLMGILSGVATFMANAAGPIMALYRNTHAWGQAPGSFSLANISKLPFSRELALINNASLTFDLVLVPFVLALVSTEPAAGHGSLANRKARC